VSAFFTLVARDIRLATRAGGSAMLAIAFFAAMAAIVPLGVGADLKLLARIAGGVLWVTAVLAALLSLDRLFQLDFDDGSVDAIALGPLSLESVSAAKILAHWLTTGLPLTLLSPVLALLFDLPAQGYVALVVSLAIGTPSVSAIGAIGTGLTLAVRRGGLILPLLVMPLIVPAVIFGAGTVLAALDGLPSAALGLLAAFSLGSVLLSPFATAAALRLNLAA
jgi:heme exporter protein B